MNGQNFGERFYVSDKNERIDQDPSAPIANPDPSSGETPVLTALVEQTPAGSGTIPLFGTPDETVDQQAPVNDVIPYEAPAAEITHYNAPDDEAVPYDAPLREATPYIAPVEETNAYNAQVGEAIPDEEAVTQVNVIPYPAPVSDAGAGLPAALLDQFESEHLRTRWNEIQGKFVDEPRLAVQQADELVSEVVEKITQMFSAEHHTLEEQWKQGNDVSTEELRKALQHYRTFFNRLVV